MIYLNLLAEPIEPTAAMIPMAEFAHATHLPDGGGGSVIEIDVCDGLTLALDYGQAQMLRDCLTTALGGDNPPLVEA